MLLLTPLYYCLCGGFERVMLGERADDGSIRSLYLYVSRSVAAIWVLYPVAWLLTDGMKLWSVSASCVLYGLLDLWSKCIIGNMVFAHQDALRTLYGHDLDFSRGKRAEAMVNRAAAGALSNPPAAATATLPTSSIASL